MAILLALVIVKGADLIADQLVNPQIQLAQNSYVIAGVAQDNTPATETKGPELEMVEPLLASASVENGMKVAKKCLQCHSFEQGGKAKTGPNLWKIVDRKIGVVDGYAYSKAMKEYDGDWTYTKLNEYLYKPRNSIPGTKMSFAGLKKVQDRADLIAYLRTLSESPAALPEPVAVSAPETAVEAPEATAQGDAADVPTEAVDIPTDGNTAASTEEQALEGQTAAEQMPEEQMPEEQIPEVTSETATPAA